MTFLFFSFLHFLFFTPCSTFQHFYPCPCVFSMFNIGVYRTSQLSLAIHGLARLVTCVDGICLRPLFSFDVLRLLTLVVFLSIQTARLLPFENCHRALSAVCVFMLHTGYASYSSRLSHHSPFVPPTFTFRLQRCRLQRSCCCLEKAGPREGKERPFLQ